MLKQKLPTSKPRPRGWPRKVVSIEVPSSHNALVDGDKLQAETVMSVTEVGSKIYKSQTYNKTLADLAYGQNWKDAIEEELSNLEQHNIWESNELLSN